MGAGMGMIRYFTQFLSALLFIAFGVGLAFGKPPLIENIRFASGYDDIAAQ